MKRSLAVLTFALLASFALAATMTESAQATVLCTTTSCPPPAGEPYPSGTTFEAVTSTLLIETSAGNVRCGEAEVAGETTAESGQPQPAKITRFEINECELVEVMQCEITTPGTPFTASFEAASGGNGTLNMTSGSFSIICPGAINCTYDAPSLEVKGGNPATLTAKEQALAKTGGILCPSKAELTVTYSVTTPKPVWVVA